MNDLIIKSFLTITIVTILSIVVKENLNRIECNLEENPPSIKPTKKFAYIGSEKAMVNVLSILNHLGYKNDPFTTEWDILWGHKDLFYAIQNQLINIQPHQLVNQHFNNFGVTQKFIINKLINENESFIMPCFYLPSENDDFEEYKKENPNALFVTKSFNHRGVGLVDSKLNYNQSERFLQRFMDNPLLVSGYKFEMGVYTIFTSSRPLRVYIYNGDVALRFCPKPYHPFDPNDLGKYVVADKYKPIWQIPEIRDFYEAGYGMRSSLIGYFKTKGINISTIFDQAEHIIRTTLINAKFDEDKQHFPGKNNFFEMLRFDFLVDDTFKVFLLEANFIPNLDHSYQPRNRLLFEQVLYNLFSLVGAAPRIKKNTLALTYDEAKMTGSDRNTAVFIDLCIKHCIYDCKHKICKLCHHCMSKNKKEILMRAYLEHMNKMECKRVIPPQMHPNFEIPDNLPKIDKWMYKWYLGKCLQDKSWCK